MSINHMLWLVLLSIISGSSFILTKDLSPVIGPILTTELRILLAAIFLVFYSFVINLDVEWKKIKGSASFKFIHDFFDTLFSFQICIKYVFSI